MRSVLASFVDILLDSGMRILLSMVNHIPGKPGNLLTEPIRCFLIRAIGIRTGVGSQISPGFFIFRMGKFIAGPNCHFGYNFQVWNFETITVGSDLLASQGIKIVCGTHHVDYDRKNIPGPVTIGDNVWLGANVTIVGPCNIGNNVIVGANSFVTGDLDSGWIYAGSPARPIRRVAP
jgi:maltose O-acetyltransferase